jgi:hypothetical protein
LRLQKKKPSPHDRAWGNTLATPVRIGTDH